MSKGNYYSGSPMGMRPYYDNCTVWAIIIVAGLSLGGCGAVKCISHFVNKDKSKNAKKVAVLQNQNVMGSDTICLNAVAMNQRTK